MIASDRAPHTSGMFRAQRRDLFLILAFAFVFDMIVTDSMSQTMDEADHLEYGARILHRQPDRSGPYMDIKTPITALNALPRQISTTFEGRPFPRIQRFFSSRPLARLPSVLAALGVIFFIYRFAYEMYGDAAARIAALLAALSPNLIAHGTIATTDGYFALGSLAALYFFRRYLLHPTFANASISGFVLAAAQITKPLAVLLYLIAGVFLVVAILRHRFTGIGLRQAAIYLLVAAVCSIGVFNVAYLFDRTLTPLRAYQFQSTAFKTAQNTLLMNVPVPVPYPVLQGLDMARHNDENGLTYGNIYLLGTLRRSSGPDFQGFKSYYLMAWLFKEPIALQILFLWGTILVCRRGPPHPRDFLFGEGLLLSALCVLVVWLSIFSKAQIGIRHILPALAIEIVIAGAVFAGWVAFSNRKKVILALLVVWLGATTFSYYPHMIPYMNEWVPDRKMAYRKLADSNLDWGQNSRLVRSFLKDNPDVVLDPDMPVSGRILVSANRLVGVAPKEKPLYWALAYRPVAHVGYAHLLFEIPKGVQDANR